jgi:hypothetical protein
MEEGLACAGQKQPELMLGAAIALVGTCASRRYIGPTQAWPHFYVANLAASTMGKEHPQAFIENAMIMAKLDDVIGPREVTSDSALEQIVFQNPVQLLIIDELARVLKPILSESDRHPISNSVATWLMSAYTKANGKMLGKGYARPDQMMKGDKKRRDVWNPCVSILGSTNEVGLWDSVGLAAMRNGFIGRWLFFNAPRTIPRPSRTRKAIEVSAYLINRLQALREGVPGHDYGMPDLAEAVASPYEVPIDDDAMNWLHDLQERQIAWQNHLGPDHLTFSLYGRLTEQTHKLALIHAVSNSPADPRIKLESVAWAYAVARGSVDYVADKATNDVSISEFAGQVMRASKLLKEKLRVTRKEMSRHMTLPPKDLDNVISHLVEAGKVVVKMQRLSDKGGPTATVYHLNQ